MLELFIPLVLCGADTAVGERQARCNVACLADAHPPGRLGVNACPVSLCGELRYLSY
ncbi:MAG: hypothetical protein WCF79_18510 [Rhodomicrobium sp.]